MATRLVRFTTILLAIIFCHLGFGFENPIWGVNEVSASSGNTNYYYQNARNPQQSEILQSLFDYASRGHTTLGYYRARQLLHGRVYLEQYNGVYTVKDVYCLKYFTNNDFRHKGDLGPEQIPDSNILNTEHTWPQSRFTRSFPEETQKSDLHHLYPSDTEMNSKRANFKFAELSGNTIPMKCSTSKLANTQIGFRFEPPVEHRGNVARALFYFSVRYKIPIDNDEEVYLRKWHNDDPVDQAEVYHHEIIVQVQGNRNPFIDRPDIVNQVEDF